MVSNIPKVILPLLLLNSYVFGKNSIVDDIIYKSVPEDGRLNFTQMANKYGHKCEEHTVTTEDGYILLLFHIPGDKTRPIYAQHGIVDSADGFMIAGNKSLAITMANAGYDVWVGNQRGNKYSRSHVTLDPNKDRKKFWDFSLQELAVYDLTATIDYILDTTGQRQLHAVFAHSQGNTIFYLLGAEKPEYNKKIKLLVALAPICYLHNTKGLVKLLIGIWPLLSTALRIFGQQEIFPSAFLRFKTLLCSQKGIGYEICAKGFFFPLAGSDPEELEPELFRAVVGRYPDTSSIKNGDHLAQIGLRKKFSKFDYGPFRNLKEYGTLVPPDYALENVTMPIALIAGKNDNLSSLKDVELLREKLPNVVKYHVMERKEFNHIDYVWGKHMPEYLHPLLLDLMKNYTKTD